MYKFRLQRVLDVREKKLEQVQMEYSRKQADALLQEKLIAGMREHRGLKFEDLRRSQQEGEVDVDRVISIQTYLFFVDRRIDQECEALEQMRDELEEVRLRLVQARKDKEALVRLREKEYEKYVAEELGKEQRFLDDVGTARFVRGRLGMDMMVQRR